MKRIIFFTFFILIILGGVLLGIQSISADEQPTLAIISPVTGDKFMPGKTYEIKWNQSNVDEVDIDVIGFSSGPGGVISVITSEYPVNQNSSTGSYLWTIPSDQLLGANLQVRIMGYKRTGSFASTQELSGYFSIIENPNILPDIVIRDAILGTYYDWSSQDDGWTKDIPGPDDEAAIRLVIINEGNRKVMGDWTYSTIINGVKTAYPDFKNLVMFSSTNADSWAERYIVHRLGKISSGSKIITFEIDSDNQFNELNENNNTYTKTFYLGKDSNRNEHDLLISTLPNLSNITRYRPGTKNIGLIRVSFKAGSEDDMHVTNITLKGDRYLDGYLKNIKLFTNGMQLGQTVLELGRTSPYPGVPQGYADLPRFPNLDFLIPKGATKEIIVRGDIKDDAFNAATFTMSLMSSGVGAKKTNGDNVIDIFGDAQGREIMILDSAPITENDSVTQKTDNNQIQNPSATFANRLKGRLLLQVYDRGRIWYVNPIDNRRYEVTFANALPLFKKFALGITNKNLYKILVHSDSVKEGIDSDKDGYSDKTEAADGYNPEIPSDPKNRGNDKVDYDINLADRLKGKLLLQVEDRGRIWYVDFDGKRWEITWANLMTIFGSLALGITNDDLEKIQAGVL